MKFVFGNFKMNGNLNQIDNYVDSLNELSPNILEKLCIFFPFPFFGFLGDCHFNFGAQDCSFQDFGAYTGDTSPILLKQCNCSYVLIGHSERRKYHYETNEIIFKKIAVAIQAGLKPVLCIGENLSERKNKYDVLRNQLSILTPRSEEIDISDLIIAYEPVWAIGSGMIPTSDEINNVAEFISETVIKIARKKQPVIYGGSVNSLNADEILCLNNIDGVLVGGACLKAMEIKNIALISEKY